MQPSSRDDFIIAIRSAFLKKENKQKFSLSALIILTLSILILGRYDFKVINYAKLSLKEIAYRSTFIFSTPENVVKNGFIATKNHFFVYEENKILKQKVKDLEIRKYNVQYIQTENERLKETLNELKFSSDEILAKVIVDKQSPFLKSIIVNKGSKHGVILGMGVLDQEYLVGKVVEVNFTTSRVLLLSDLNSKIPVDILPNNIQSILSGTGDNIGKIQYIKEEALIESDSIVYTSGAGGIFKPGVPIGRTVKNSLNSEINVEFYSEFSQLRFVKLRSYKAEEN
ncbi:rod shape-determining protein MreC [Candidatus Pelagibacter communis]|uniref:rod shape-determining protein MreC n=1 Tax=Pelagibacter ubique TaxID=198252 RepID=UPI00094C3E69|nr:rod shape-determining protein MreC [Candidatus Pelagibacter ubique]